jgi:hypothetical protein
VPAEPRRRVSFDADEDVWNVVRTKGRGDRVNYLNTAVRRFEDPSYRFREPASVAEASPESLLRGRSKSSFWSATPS